jgi:hypothetical protein
MLSDTELDLTAEQREICRAVADAATGAAIKVQAFAGTGKTTTLAAVAAACPRRRFLYVVFNRAAAADARRKMPANVEVRTAHSVAYRQVGHLYSGRLTERSWQWLTYLREKMPRALDSVARSGRDATSAGALIIRTLEQYLRSVDVELGPEHVPRWCGDGLAQVTVTAASFLWQNIRNPNSTAPITHDCYLKLFYLQNCQLAPIDTIIMLDEAQDADPVIFALVRRHPGTRIVVGDTYQQLYQWRGAVNALDSFETNPLELALTQTFRFGGLTAQWANRVLAICGEKLRIAPAAHSTQVRVDFAPADVEATLARSNAGALDQAVAALDRRRRVHVMGGAAPLIKLVRDAYGLYCGKPGSGELAVFNSWSELKAAGQGDRSGSGGDPSLQILVNLIEDRGARVLDTCQRLEACVDSPHDAQVTISTVHKAKGLEWERVAVAEDLSPFVRKSEGKPKLLFEEACVMYVALTRAKRELVLHPDCLQAIEASGKMVGITEALSVSGIAADTATTAPRKDSKADRDGRARSGRRDLRQTGGAPAVMIVYDRDQGIGTIPENLRGRAERRPRRKSRRHSRRGRVSSDPTSES